MSRIPTIIDSPDGTVRAVNVKRLNECPYWLQPNPPNNNLVVPANQASPFFVMSVSGQGPAAVYAMSAQRTAACLVFLQVQDGPQIRSLMNAACHIDAIFGNYGVGARPYYLPEALMMDENRAILCSITDISGAINNVRLTLEAMRLLTREYDHTLSKIRNRMENRQYLTLPYFYTLDNGFSLVAAAPAVNTETITIGQDHHFEIFQITAIASSGPNSFKLNIVNADTGEPLVDAPLGVTQNLSSGLIVGNASFPVRFHEPRFVELRSKLVVTLENLAAVPNTIRLVLGGRALADKLWK
jgi:hypothetical protein